MEGKAIFSDISGYICNLEIYYAQGKSLISTIFSVLSPYLNLWHDVYMDNYYNSVKIAEELLKHKTNVCGTIRANRGMPICLKSVTLKDKSMEFRTKGKILIQKWNTTKKVINLILTIHSVNMVQCEHKRTKRRSLKPICEREYNKIMKGIDCTALINTYHTILYYAKQKMDRKTSFIPYELCIIQRLPDLHKNSENSTRFKKFLMDFAIAWINGNEEEQES